MEGGFLKMSMQTNSSASKGSSVTKDLTSKFKYNDGQWWKVISVILRYIFDLFISINYLKLMNLSILSTNFE